MKTESATPIMSALPSSTDWQNDKWRKAEKYVEKLQQRIFRAEKKNDKRKVRDLQRMLIRSKSALLMSIRRVTQTNKGKRTAGVDGFKALSETERINLYNQMANMDITRHRPKPAYRTYIKKKNGKLRPLGIPTIKDRIYQNIAKLALEPQWEARFEPTSYGFRPKRGCHDAIARIHQTLKGRSTRTWIFEGDFKACFDTLNHGYILKRIEGFPQTKVIANWLKAGFVDKNVFNKTTEGTPQGGIISPLLANIALHGMEETLGIKYDIRNNANKTKYALCFYADDFIIMCPTKKDAEHLHPLLSKYLTDRGLTLAEDKSRITNVEEGFDFLGFNVRRYSVTKYKKGHAPREGKTLLIKPSNQSARTLKTKIKDEFDRAKGTNATALIGRLNPIITGTANYWKPSVATKKINNIDYYTWNKVKCWINRSHPTKSWTWKKKRYFKADKTGQSRNRWIFTDPIKGNQLKKMSWTGIKRHALITHTNSPFDTELTEYYRQRDIKEFEGNNVASRQKLAKRQNYACPICGRSIINCEEGLETHHIIPKHHGGSNEYKNLQLAHISCHIAYHKAFPAKAELPPKAKVKAWQKWYRKLIG